MGKAAEVKRLDPETGSLRASAVLWVGLIPGWGMLVCVGSLTPWLGLIQPSCASWKRPKATVSPCGV